MNKVNLSFNIQSYNDENITSNPSQKLMDWSSCILGSEGGDVSLKQERLYPLQNKIYFDNKICTKKGTFNIEENIGLFSFTSNYFKYKEEIPKLVKVKNKIVSVISCRDGELITESLEGKFNNKEKLELDFYKNEGQLLYIETDSKIKVLINQKEYEIVPVINGKEKRDKKGMLFFTGNIQSVEVNNNDSENFVDILIAIWSKYE